MDDRPAPELSIVVPLFNEQENAPKVHRRVSNVMRDSRTSYELIFVDDGSQDGTPDILQTICRDDPNVLVLRLSRNFGHQCAISAGLDESHGRAVMVMDGDLQDPPEVIPQFLALWREGNDVVYAVRQKRKEGWMKRLAYAGFYRLLRSISEIDIPLDSGDFGLMDRRVVEAIKSLPERKRFVRGLRSYVGFRQAGLVYNRAAREAGEPKYNLKALYNLAVDGLVSFSGDPLRLVTYLGLFSAGIAILLLIWVVTDAFYQHTAPRGWASTVVIVLFMGSVQLISLGIIGEYIRLIFFETKRRPTYIVAERQTSETLKKPSHD